MPARADGRWGEDGHEAAGGDVELGVESSLETGGWQPHGLPPQSATVRAREVRSLRPPGRRPRSRTASSTPVTAELLLQAGMRRGDVSALTAAAAPTDAQVTADLVRPFHRVLSQSRHHHRRRLGTAAAGQVT